MSKWTESPVFKVNKWVTDSLRTDGVIPAASAYTTLVDTNDAYQDEDTSFTLPFMMPAQQTPESTTPYSDGAYKELPLCVYTASQTGGHDQPWTKYGRITYIFYSGDVEKLFEIATYVHDLTNREDWSATDINYFYRLDNTNPFDFKCISFITGEGPTPASDEGGRHAYMCVIEYDATYEGSGRAGNYGATTGLGRI
jgi:hypothetical protein